MNTEEERIIFPIVCMTSIEPIRYKSAEQLDLFPVRFKISFSIFKEKNLIYITIVLSTLNSKLSPQILASTFDDLHSLEARKFIEKSLSHFEKFKRAIIFFDDKPYTVIQFEDMITEWYKSLKEITQ